MRTFFSVFLCALLLLVLPEQARGTRTLATGAFMKLGLVTPTLKFQSSGRLLAGGCPKAYGIKDCFQLSLGSKGNLQTTHHHKRSYNSTEGFAEYRALIGPVGRSNRLSARSESQRQRIELLSWPEAKSGQTFVYSWKYRLKKTKTARTFFHLSQLIERGSENAPVVFLSAVNDRLVVTDTRRHRAASTPLSKFWDRTTNHKLVVRYGKNGAIAYRISDAKTGRTILTYRATGNMGNYGSVKHGMYRASFRGMQSAHAFTGDYSAKRLR